MASFFDGLPEREPSAATGFAGNRIDRRSEHRSADAVADGARRSGGAALSLPRRQGAAQGGSDPLFTGARGGRARRDARRGGAPRLGGRRARGSRRRSPRPPPVDETQIALTDLRSLAVAGGGVGGASRRAGAGAEPRQLARAPPLLRQLRRGDGDRRRRLPARLPGLRHAAFPAHRPGGDHARDRRRATARSSAARRASRRACIPASPASSSRARRSRTRSAARRWRKPASASGASRYHASQPWPFPVLADDRLPRRGAVHRHPPRRGGTGRLPLVLARRGRARCSPARTRRASRRRRRWPSPTTSSGRGRRVAACDIQGAPGLTWIKPVAVASGRNGASDTREGAQICQPNPSSSSPASSPPSRFSRWRWRRWISPTAGGRAGDSGHGATLPWRGGSTPSRQRRRRGGVEDVP